ncbi:MAG: acyl-CoA dehydrogenase family protein [Chloroflexota bacterium]|nr:acyl-CoA dehydrogenase family protein [Chloroflexota bacterium]
MDFELTEEQKMMRTNARDFIEREIMPVADEYDRKGTLTRDELVGFIKQLMPFGYYNGVDPEELGGAGLDHKIDAMLTEELSRAWAGLCGAVRLANMGHMLTMCQSDEMKKKYVPRIRTGEFIGCGGITEPNVGSDSRHVETTITSDGDFWVINGTKLWISNAQTSDAMMVIGVTDKSLGALGMTMVMAERETSPYQVRELHKVGLRAWPTAEVSFVDVKVPKENTLSAPSGDQGSAAYRSLMVGFEGTRTWLAAMSTGIAQAAIDAAISYARERKQFGRPIGSFQMVQEMIVDSLTETESARLLYLRSASLLDRGERCRWQSAMAKGFATDMAVRVASKSMQIHGAMGVSDEYPVERYFRDAQTMLPPDGTLQIQKLVVGREVIGIRAIS